MGLITPVTDRTEKSSYEADDVNRVNSNLQYLATVLTQAGFQIVLTKPTPTNLTTTSFPRVTVINNMKRNILDIIAGFYPVAEPPPVIDLTRKQIFDYAEANNLEKNIALLYHLYENVLTGLKYCGTFSCGESEVLA